MSFHKMLFLYLKFYKSLQTDYKFFELKEYKNLLNINRLVFFIVKDRNSVLSQSTQLFTVIFSLLGLDNADILFIY